jgi:hypothetical protein
LFLGIRKGRHCHGRGRCWGRHGRRIWETKGHGCRYRVSREGQLRCKRHDIRYVVDGTDQRPVRVGPKRVGYPKGLPRTETARIRKRRELRAGCGIRSEGRAEQAIDTRQSAVSRGSGVGRTGAHGDGRVPRGVHRNVCRRSGAIAHRAGCVQPALHTRPDAFREIDTVRGRAAILLICMKPSTATC